jgi:hypothetical protein
MSNTAHATPGASGQEQPIPFTPVSVRPRHDGWTPGKQVAFIHALAETACVDEACRRVQMSQQSAYQLRTRTDAVSFRQAWAVALDLGTSRLADRAMARAMNGVAVPIFYKGEKVGERRVFNERLTMFLLRMHAPERYGAWRDQTVQTRAHPDGLAVLFKAAVRAVAEDALADEQGAPRPKRNLLKLINAPQEDGDETEPVSAFEEMTERYEKIFEEQEREIQALNGRLTVAAGTEGSACDGGSTWPTSEPL